MVSALAVAVWTPAAPGAVSATPCWKSLLNDWYDGQIDKLYRVDCYKQAIAHLPTDVSVYSSARDDIDRALQLAIAHAKNPSTPVPAVTDTQQPVAATTTTTPATTTTGGSATPGTTTTPTTTATQTVATTTTSPGRTESSGPIPSAIDSSSPGGATSFPLPLAILGGLALFLLAAGVVGLLVRRMQGRGEPPATP